MHIFSNMGFLLHPQHFPKNTLATFESFGRCCAQNVLETIFSGDLIFELVLKTQIGVLEDHDGPKIRVFVTMQTNFEHTSILAGVSRHHICEKLRELTTSQKV